MNKSKQLDLFMGSLWICLSDQIYDHFEHSLEAEIAFKLRYQFEEHLLGDLWYQLGEKLKDQLEEIENEYSRD